MGMFAFKPWIAASLLCGAMGVANATTMVHLSTDQLVDASDLVVRGTVTEVWTEPDAQGRIWTRAQVEVLDVLKGDADAEAVVVDQPGGDWGGMHTTVYSVARFSRGEDAVLFLEQSSDGRITPVGMFQGKFTVQLDPYSQVEVARQVLMPPNQRYDHRFLPLAAAPDRVTVDSLEAQVRDRVAAGWDGQPIPGASPDRLRRINRTQPGVK